MTFAIVLQVLQLIATLLLGVGAFSVAIQQSRTARDKLVLDLSQQRLRIINSVDNIVAEAITDGAQRTTVLLEARLVRSLVEAQYLFGSEVPTYLKTVVTALQIMSSGHRLRESHRASDAEHEASAAREDAALDVLVRHASEFSKLVANYVQMDHKLSRASSVLPFFWR